MKTIKEDNIFYMWLKTALQKLDDDFKSKKFNPMNEQDFRCHLYHCLIETRNKVEGITYNHSIMNEYKIPGSSTSSGQPKSIDIILTENSEPRLCIELKESNSNFRSAKSMENRLRKNIKNLKNNMETLQSLGANVQPVILYWFWGSRRGIISKVEEEMNVLRDKYPNLQFWCGPRR